MLLSTWNNPSNTWNQKFCASEGVLVTTDTVLSLPYIAVTIFSAWTTWKMQRIKLNENLSIHDRVGKIQNENSKSRLLSCKFALVAILGLDDSRDLRNNYKKGNFYTLTNSNSIKLWKNKNNVKFFQYKPQSSLFHY